MIQPQINQQQWLKLPSVVRLEFVRIFGIPRSSGAYIDDNVVRSDGHTDDDLKSITIEKMQAFTGSHSEDFFGLINETIEKVQEAFSSQVKETSLKENYDRLEKYVGMVKELRQQCYEFALGKQFDIRITEIFELKNNNIKPDVKEITETKQDEGGNSKGDGQKKGGTKTKDVR